MTLVPLPAPFTGVTVKEKFKLLHTLPRRMEKLNSVPAISHSESTIDEEVEFTTSTQYVISGSTLGISRLKGAVQVREMSVSTRWTSGDPTAESSPVIRELIASFVSVDILTSI